MVHLLADFYWADVKALVPFLMLARIPLICAVILVAFPLFSLRGSLLANLFDVSPWGMAVVTLASLSTAWTTLVTGWIILRNGQARFPGIEFRAASELPGTLHFVWSALLAVTTVAAIVFYTTKQSSPRQSRITLIAGLLVGTVAGILGGGSLLLAVHALYKYAILQPGPVLNCLIEFIMWIAVKVGPAGYLTPDGALLNSHLFSMVLLFLTLFLYVTVGLLHFAPRRLRVPTVTYVLLLLMLGCWTFSGITFALDRWRFPVILLVALWLLGTANLRNTDHFYRTLGPNTKEPFPQTPGPEEVLLASKSKKIILVAASGGGIQAAAWTARVLTGLQVEWQKVASQDPKRDPDAFAKSLRLISSVSGGGVGAMYFVNQYNPQGTLPDAGKLHEVLMDAQTSSLEDVSWGLAYHDFLHVVFPIFPRTTEGRGRALERAWKSTSPDAARLECKLTDWANSVREGLRPANIFNATLVESGERLLLSTTFLPRAANTIGHWDFHTVYQQLRDVAVVTAARLAATFPYVAPASRADMDPPAKGSKASHVVDGAYYDNYGIATLTEWLDCALESLAERNKLASVEQVLIVQIREQPGPRPVPAPAGSRRGWFFQAYAPLAALFAVRTAAQLSHNQVEMKMIQDKWAARGKSIETSVFEFGSRQNSPHQPNLPQPPLSWHLTPRQKEAIESEWNDQRIGSEWNKIEQFLA